mgnify:CR=1 FL=1
MMEENFRRIADAVRLPEGSRARIRAQIASRAEEQEASMQNKSLEEWRNGEKIDGTFSHLYSGWDHAELISDDPALCIRRITRDEDGAEKMQYMAADPADLLPVLTGNIRFDLTWLSENYKAVTLDDQAFIVRDEDGNPVSEYFWAAYGANDGKGWFRLEIMHDTTWNLSPDYIVDGTFEEAYYYTTASGYEFLITADEFCRAFTYKIYLKFAVPVHGNTVKMIGNNAFVIAERFYSRAVYPFFL